MDRPILPGNHQPSGNHRPGPATVLSLQAVLHAADYAARRHANHRRKGANGEPYINHLLEVASLVAGALDVPDDNVIIAALLHDVIEDTAITRDEVAREFGEDVASLVAEVTDDKTLPRADRKRLQIETAPHKTPRAQLIKVADKISNLRSLLTSPPPDWTEERRREYFAWARSVVDALPAPHPVLLRQFHQLCSDFDRLHA